MIDEYAEVPQDFWRVYESVRVDQLLSFAWDGKDAREFAAKEVAIRKEIDREHGPEYAIFAVPHIQKFTTADPDHFYLKVLWDSPFEAFVEGGG